MTNFRGFDGYAAQRHTESIQNPTQRHGSGSGTFAGVIAIVCGAMLLVPSGGLSIFLILAGCAGMAGDKVQQKASAEIEQAAADQDVTAVDRAGLDGCTKLVFIGVLALVIIGMVVAGLMRGS